MIHGFDTISQRLFDLTVLRVVTSGIEEREHTEESVGMDYTRVTKHPNTARRLLPLPSDGLCHLPFAIRRRRTLNTRSFSGVRWHRRHTHAIALQSRQMRLAKISVTGQTVGEIAPAKPGPDA